MDARLLEQLRRASQPILAGWQAQVAGDWPQGSRALRDLSTGLLPLLLDSLQFEGFVELEHLAARVGETACAEGVKLGTILRAVFELRAVLNGFLSKKSKAGGGHPGQSEVEKEIDRFAATCAQAYVESYARWATTRERKQFEQLESAFDAIGIALVILDSDLAIRGHNRAFREMLGIAAAIEDCTIEEVAGEQAAMRALIEAAGDAKGRVTGEVRLKRAPALAGVTQLAGFSPALFLVELDLQAGAGAASALRAGIQALVARAEGSAFGKMMKNLRREKGISMRSLAEQLGMARGYVSNIESGKAVPSFKAIVRIVEFLDPDGENGLMALGVVQRLPAEVREKLTS